jgi:hypothetical protein
MSSPRPDRYPAASTYERGSAVAKKTVRVSDVSGEEIEEGKGATVTIRFADARRGALVLDVTDAEAEAMGAKGRKVGRRGRRPKSESAS